MRKDKLIILAVFVLVIGVAAGLQAIKGDGAKTVPASGPSPADANKVMCSGEFRGFSLALHAAAASHPYEKLLDEMADVGANSVCLVVMGYQENASSASIFIDSRKAPSPERIVEIIGHAKKRGLKVVLMPIVLLENGREGEWRGKIKPDSWDDWWGQYNSYIIHYAKLAQQAGVDVFMVGSELISTETYNERWRSLVAEVRKVYGGKLSYSSNWDHYRAVTWWDDLDIVGMTTYYDLTGGKKPTMETLLESWAPIKKEILEWQATVNRPILFTEVGWPNQITCGQFPWDYYRSPKEPDPEAQANCFRSFFETWANEPVMAGYMVWEWRNHPDQKPGNPEDSAYTSYIPEGKPAMDVIRQYLTAPAVCVARTPAPATAPKPASMPAASQEAEHKTAEAKRVDADPLPIPAGTEVSE